MSDSFPKLLATRAAEPYRRAGRHARHFARGKLGGDSVFTAILRHGLIPDGARVLDIGCGQGLLAAWLLAAHREADCGNYPAEWPAAPEPVSIHGIDLKQKDIERARTAFGDRARFTLGNMCTTAFTPADAVVALDVLHYVSYAEQEDVLHRIHAALSSDGVLILRVSDAGWRLRSVTTRMIDRAALIMRGQNQLKQHCRSREQWFALLEQIGFSVRTVPLDQGAAYANILLVANPRAGQPAAAVRGSRRISR